MTILEAIKSGCNFKRRSSKDPCWLCITKYKLPGLLGYAEDADGGECVISEVSAKDLIADDWIIKPDFEGLLREGLRAGCFAGDLKEKVENALSTYENEVKQ